MPKLIGEPVLTVSVHNTPAPKTCYICDSPPTKFYKGVYSSKKYATCEKHKIMRSISA